MVSYEVYVGEEWLGNVSTMPIFIGFDGEVAGLYTIGIVAVYDGCVSDMATVDFEWDPTSVDEAALVGAIYPNPTNGSFKIQGRDIASVAVYNLMGQKVFETENGMLKPSTMQSDSKQETEINIDATGWAKGIYMITLTGLDGRVDTRKLIVE